MATKKIRTTRVEEEEKKVDSGLPKLIRSYLIDGEEFNPELKIFQYRIHVYKFDKFGKAVKLSGRIFDDIEQLETDLGTKYGTSDYKLFIEIFDTSGDKVTVCRIENYHIEWSGPEAALEEEPAAVATLDDQISNAVEILTMKHAHEKELKQMEIQKEMFIAAMNAKNSGGLKAQDMIELIRTGMDIAAGKQIGGAADVQDDRDPLGLAALLQSPVIQQVLANLGSRMPAAPPLAGPSETPQTTPP